MRLVDLLQLSLSNLWRRKLRTLLTILGVLIGITSVVVMMSIGIAQGQYMEELMSSDSSINEISVRGKGAFGPPGMDSSSSKEKKLTDKAIEEILALDHVKSVDPILEYGVQCYYGQYQNYLNIQGVPLSRLQSMNLEYSEGGFSLENYPGSLPLIIGQQVNYNFYNPKANRGDYYYGGGFYYEEDSSTPTTTQPPPDVNMYTSPVLAIFDMQRYWESRSGEGSTTPPKKYVLQASGIIQPDKDSFYDENAYSVYTEIETLKTFLNSVFKGKAWEGQPKTKSGRSTGEVVYSELKVLSENIDYAIDLTKEIERLGYQANSNASWIKRSREESARMKKILGGIGAVSLFVASIGIANTMMMSIYERTKEIGVFKVLGCSLKNIGLLFLMESGFIGLIGGSLGLALSYAGSKILNVMNAQGGDGGGIAMKLSIIPVPLAISGLLFGIIVGVVSGMLPALRAMRLSPLEAIRNQ